MTISDTIKQSRDYYIVKFAKKYGDPKTDWNRIFYNLLVEFECYAEDEASAGEYGTIAEAFYNGDYSEVDVDNEFDSFTDYLDLVDYDF